MLAYRPSHLIVIKDLPILLMRAVLLVSSTDQCILHLQMSSCDDVNMYFDNAMYLSYSGTAAFQGQKPGHVRWQIAVHCDLIGGKASAEADLLRCSARLLTRSVLAVSLFNDTQVNALMQGAKPCTPALHLHVVVVCMYDVVCSTSVYCSMQYTCMILYAVCMHGVACSTHAGLAQYA